MKRAKSRQSHESPPGRETVGLRIVGGKLRGRPLAYSGDQRTRPMKDRVREAVFNLLGPAVVGSHAIDLFAGTGALGLEAISRGAVRATFLERHLPTCADRAERGRAWHVASRWTCNLPTRSSGTNWASCPRIDRGSCSARRRLSSMSRGWSDMLGLVEPISRRRAGRQLSSSSKRTSDLTSARLPDAEAWDVRTVFAGGGGYRDEVSQARRARFGRRAREPPRQEPRPPKYCLALPSALARAIVTPRSAA